LMAEDFAIARTLGCVDCVHNTNTHLTAKQL